jgi:hypothetical protein
MKHDFVKKNGGARPAKSRMSRKDKLQAQMRLTGNNKFQTANRHRHPQSEVGSPCIDRRHEDVLDSQL